MNLLHCLSDFFHARHVPNVEPYQRAIDRLESLVLHQVAFPPVFVSVAGVVQFNRCPHAEIRIAYNEVHALRLDPVELASFIPVPFLPNPDDGVHRHLRQHNRIGEGLSQPVKKYLFRCRHWFGEEIGGLSLAAAALQFRNHGDHKNSDHEQSGEANQSFHVHLRVLNA